METEASGASSPAGAAGMEGVGSPDQSSDRVRFGAFEADLRTGELTRDGRRRRLQKQPFQLLAILLGKPGELVTREELQARLWPRTTVDFDHGLNKAVSKIRDALGDSAENPRFIETVARRGYRFLGDVRVIREREPALPDGGVVALVNAEPPQTVEMQSAEPTVVDPVARSRHRGLAGVSAGFALALLLGALVWVAHPWQRTVPEIRSLAVLPLENLSDDHSQDYFADGMTEELITRLGQISSLRVISRTSAMTYKNNHRPLSDVARDLDVQAVVEGSVLRSGEQVRITAQLIAVPADRHMWAQSYDGDLRDTLGLQSRVARDVAEQIRTALNPREQLALGTSKAVNPEAFEAYLKGRYFWNKRTGDGLSTAISYFSHSIQLDPTFAEAFSGLADAYALSGDWEYGVLPPREAFVKAKAAAEKALSLDNSLGEAHTSLAFALDLYGWDWAAAEAEYRRAIELTPSYATAHLWYGWHLILTGRQPAGIAEVRRAASLDPLSLIIGADLADVLCIGHQYDEAVEQNKRTLDLDPNFAVAHYELGQALTQQHKYDEAIASFRKAIELAGHRPVFDSSLAFAYAISRRREAALDIVRDLRAQYEQAGSADANIALVYVGLGDYDEAMIFLNRAYDARFNPSILLRPAWDPLRSDARFRGLLQRIGIPG